ncbi:MAG: methyltransferase domain-containing protein [Polyangiaceae bacterium]|nr:methyltransferase domain-containing protein [Polyangiaceae bacterium]
MFTKSFEPSAAQGPNADQIRFWNDNGGPTWARLQPQLSIQLQPFGEMVLAAAQVQPGERVLDVGCGGGDTTRAVAKQVGPTGRVTGMDISEALLTVADRRLREEGHTNAQLVLADAQTAEVPVGAYDIVMSRFGVMFFADPVAAFQNLARALVPGGRLAFVCWRAPHENEWFHVPLSATAKHVPITPMDPYAPGPCALADEKRTARILSDAGFTEVQLTRTDHPVSLGGARSLDEAVEFLLQVGPAARALREAGEAYIAPVSQAIRDAVKPYSTGEGVALGGSVWVVTARKPAQ